MPALPVAVSVIMPIRNEEAFVHRSLGAVLAQDHPPERLEVLVADGMSDDATREVVRRLAADHPRHRVEIVDNPGRTVPHGFNAALARATGEVIVRVDGHTVVAPDYVTACVAVLEESGADLVGGRMRARGDGPIGEAIALATSSRFGIGNAAFHYGEGDRLVDTVYMGAWRRATFDRHGGFDPEFVRNQDDEFAYRIRAGGGRVLLSDSIRSVYTARGSLRALASQYRQYGTWKVRVLQAHPQQMSARQFAPPLFVLALVGGAALAPGNTLVRRCWLGMLGAYGAGAAAASARIARREGLRHAPLLPVVFPVLHVSYGAGFLHGLVRFRDRWGGWRRA